MGSPMRLIFSLVLACVLGSCAPKAAPAALDPTLSVILPPLPPLSAFNPSMSVILPSDAALSPPTRAEIAELEAALSVDLTFRLNLTGQGLGVTPTDYYRQYTVLEVGGRRIILVKGIWVGLGLTV